MKSSGKKPLIILTAYLVVVGCGDGERKFDNPYDPDATKTPSPLEKSSATNENPEQTNKENQPNSSFSFAGSFTVNPGGGCSNVKKVKVFEHDGDVRVFVHAKCGAVAHVYSSTYSPLGTVTSATSLVSGRCSGTLGVSDFDVDKGSSGYLAVFVCMSDLVNHDVFVQSMDFSGNLGVPKKIESMPLPSETQKNGYLVRWNSSSNAYGVVLGFHFQRFNESAIALGVPLDTRNASGRDVAGNFREGVVDASVVAGKWVLYYTADNSDMAVTAVVNSDGDGKICPFGNPYRFIDDKYVFVVPRFNAGDGWISSLDDSGCAGSYERVVRVVKDVQNDLRRGFRQNGSFATLGSSAFGMAFFSVGVRILVVQRSPFSDDIPKDIFVTKSGITNHTQLSVIQGKLYIAYDKDGDGVVTYSKESVK